MLAILAADMNFIGPRPLQPATVATFGALGRVRCQMRPGLTGWAQVNGNTRLSDSFQKLALDIWYIDRRSALLDARILFLTAATLLRGEKKRKERRAPAGIDLRFRSGDLLADSGLVLRTFP